MTNGAFASLQCADDDQKLTDDGEETCFDNVRDAMQVLLATSIRARATPTLTPVDAPRLFGG